MTSRKDFQKAESILGLGIISVRGLSFIYLFGSIEDGFTRIPECGYPLNVDRSSDNRKVPALLLPLVRSFVTKGCPSSYPIKITMFPYFPNH